MNEICTPDMVTEAFLSGMWRGGLGVGLMIFGIIGWPATRYVLGVLSKPITKKPAQIPVGSKFWDNYGQKNWKPDFAVEETTPYQKKKSKAGRGK